MSLHAMNRRTFLGTASAAAAATLFTSRFGWAAADHKIDKIGVQLYTVRDQMEDDFDGTIAKVAQIGYKEVEFAGYFGHTGQQVRAVFDKNGLARSTHVQYGELDDKLPSVIESSKAIGPKYIVCPWIPEDLRKSPDIWKRAAENSTNVANRQEGGHSVRLSQSLVRICAGQREASLRHAAQGVRRQSGEDGNGPVLDHGGRRRSLQVFRSLSRTLPAGPRERHEEDPEISDAPADRISATR